MAERTVRRRKGKDPRGEMAVPLDGDPSTSRLRSMDSLVERQEGTLSGINPLVMEDPMGSQSVVSGPVLQPLTEQTGSPPTVLTATSKQLVDSGDQQEPEQQPPTGEDQQDPVQQVPEMPVDPVPLTLMPGDSGLTGWCPPEPPTDQGSTQGQGDKPTKVKLWNATAEITNVVTTRDTRLIYGGARPKTVPTLPRRGTFETTRGMPAPSATYTPSAAAIRTSPQVGIVKDVEDALAASFRDASEMAKEMTSAAKSLGDAAQKLARIISSKESSGSLGATSSTPQPASFNRGRNV